MPTVDVSASFSKEEKHYNGLDAIVKDLIERPLDRHVIVAVIERSSLRIDDRKGGEMTPTIRLVNVEVMEGDEAEVARTMLNARFRARTGAQEDPQMSLFEPGEPSIDERMAADGSAPSEPQRDPTAGPWPGDADYPPGAPSEPTAAADDTADEPRRGRGRRS
jgi:hypothetical protein